MPSAEQLPEYFFKVYHYLVKIIFEPSLYSSLHIVHYSLKLIHGAGDIASLFHQELISFAYLSIFGYSAHVHIPKFPQSVSYLSALLLGRGHGKVLFFEFYGLKIGYLEILPQLFFKSIKLSLIFGCSDLLAVFLILIRIESLRRFGLIFGHLLYFSRKPASLFCYSCYVLFKHELLLGLCFYSFFHILRAQKYRLLLF